LAKPPVPAPRHGQGDEDDVGGGDRLFDRAGPHIGEARGESGDSSGVARGQDQVGLAGQPRCDALAHIAQADDCSGHVMSPFKISVSMTMI
jgi:hypothetical protein